MSRFGTAWTRTAALALTVALAGCAGEVYVETPVAPPATVVAPAVVVLDLILTRTGPNSAQLDWSYDSAVSIYDVYRNGALLAQVTATSLIDATAFYGEQVCYGVNGYDRGGHLVSQSVERCVVYN